MLARGSRRRNIVVKTTNSLCVSQSSTSSSTRLSLATASDRACQEFEARGTDERYASSMDKATEGCGQLVSLECIKLEITALRMPPATVRKCLTHSCTRAAHIARLPKSLDYHQDEENTCGESNEASGNKFGSNHGIDHV
eukprot:1715644-Pleurochrysis_carterae.AAC.1